MGTELESRAILAGRLTVIVPAIAAIPFVVFLGLRMFGPSLSVYYVLGGVTLGWEWYSIAIPRWAEWLAKKGVQDSEVAHLAHRSGLVWPGAAAIGFFALHTTVIAVCAILFAPWLGRWFAWILTGKTITTGAGDYYLQHMELLSIFPALAIGYVVSRHFPRLAIWAWLLPTIILLYKLLTFTDPSRSVLISNPWSRFSYFFVIERSLPIFSPGFGGIDPVRVVQQMVVVAPFFSGLAYSVGALAARHNLLHRFAAGTLSTGPEPSLSQTEVIVEESVVEESERPAH